jgi:hypothetical protein
MRVNICGSQKRLQFQKTFGTEKACQKQLFRLRWPEGFKRPRGGHAEAYFQSPR